MSNITSRRSVESYGSPRPSSSSNQFPFPQYETSPRGIPGRLDTTRRGSTADSVTSIGGVLDSAGSGTSSIPEVGNNAISTLLQPPIVRTGLLPHTVPTSGHRIPSTRDIPPVTLTNIPHVDASVFRPYLNQAGSLYEAFQRARESDGSAQRRPRASSKEAETPATPSSRWSRRQESTSSVAAHDGIPLTPNPSQERPQPIRRGSGSVGRRGPLSVTPLSTIPSVYFEEDFRLENPRTFDVVSERSEIVRPQPGANRSVQSPGNSGRKALATNAILQEKLSWYMDTVEVHLISAISTASSSFFAALGSLRELHTEASESVTKIKSLRQDLAKLDKDMAVGGLKVVAMRRRRENVRKLGDAVEQLQEVVESVASCEDQVDKGEIEDALKGLTEVEQLIAGDRHANAGQRHDRKNGSPMIDLRGIKALEGAAEDMAYLQKRIGKGFESRFLEALLGDLRKHVDTVPSISTFQRWDKSFQRSRGHHDRTPSAVPAYLHMDDSVRSTLRANLEGLAQSGSIMPAAVAYREAALREIKALIKRPLPSSNDDDSESTMSASTQGGRHMTQQEKSSILARNLRALDADDAEDMLKKMYSNVGEGLRRLGTQVKILLDVTSSFALAPSPSGLKLPKSPPMANIDRFVNDSIAGPASCSLVQQEEIQQALDMSSLLGQAVDIAQSQITKILKSRSEQSTRLPIASFIRYFHLNRMFADECEAVSGRGGQALKTIVHSHIKEFVSHFGDGQMRQLVQTMDADRWEAKDFTDQDSQTLSRILEASTKDIEVWTRACHVWDKSSSNNANGQINGEVKENKTRSAIIDEQRYILTESALLALHGIEQFERLITAIPNMTPEITASMLEYLRLFNSRCQQLVLGAGATKIAGLKNITTKHLALASQALSFVTALTPHVREFVRRQQSSSSGAGQLMADFDKVRRLYQEHQYGVHDKFVEIMSGRAGSHVGAMKKIKWDDEKGGGGDTVSSYMETLVKETLTLHKVLAKFLPENTVQMIMEPVFRSYGEELKGGIEDAGARTGVGRERIRRDVAFLKSRMSKIEGSEELGRRLMDAVDAIEVSGEKKGTANDSANQESKAGEGEKT